MIGLGSNRLTVCRRGGMSVTQAGRGGMEWLAGGRMPRWASPYSAAATAALKAQFPTQWPTIRDYGFAHPEIVGYMNAYAPEDAKIAYSLVPLDKVRLAKTNGTAWFNTGLINAKGFLVDFDIVFDQVSGDGNRTIGTFKSGVRSWVVITNGYCNLGISSDMFDRTYLLDTETLYHFNLSTISGDSYVNVNGTRVLTRTNTYSPGSPEIWVGKVNGLSEVQKGQYGVLTFYDVDSPSTEIAKFVPFVRNNTMGFLDLLTGNFKTNQGSGDFTEVLRASYPPHPPSL